MTIHPDILKYNAAMKGEDRAIGEALATAIDRGLAKTDGVECKIWHRHPVWFIEGNPIVGYSALKGCVRLLFWSGQSFDEPGLRNEGSFKAAEARYTSVDEIDAKALARWLRKSVEIQWDYKNIVKRKGRLEWLKGGGGGGTGPGPSSPGAKPASRVTKKTTRKTTKTSAPTKTPSQNASGLDALGVLASRTAAGLAGVEVGVACAGTPIESRTYKVRGRAFLFVRPGNLMLKLTGESLARAMELAKAGGSAKGSSKAGPKKSGPKKTGTTKTLTANAGAGKTGRLRAGAGGGRGGWVTILSGGGGLVKGPILSRWVKESHALFA